MPSKEKLGFIVDNLKRIVKIYNESRKSLDPVFND
jgi:hypothetical protein